MIAQCPDGKPNVSNSGNKTNNISTGNKVNIDNSKKNVNVNIDNSKDIHVNNSRNTSVRRNTQVLLQGLLMYMEDTGTGAIIHIIFIRTVRLYGDPCGIHGDFL